MSTSTPVAIAGFMLALATISGCGSESAAPAASASHSSASPSPTSSESTEPAVADNQETCDKLARTWLVKAKKFIMPLYMALPEEANKYANAMTDATDRMEIEGCKGPAVDLALQGNYQAAVVSAQLLTCDTSDLSAALACGEKAGKRWDRKGIPLMAQIRDLVE